MKMRWKIGEIKALNSYFTGNIGELSTNLIYQRNHIVCTLLGKSDFGEDLFCHIFLDLRIAIHM